MRRAADQFVDTVVTNAVLNVRGRLDARQRDASKAFFVVSNDPSGHLNDNQSNKSWSQRAKQLSTEYKNSQQKQKRSRYDDGDDDSKESEEGDSSYDDDDDDDDLSLSPIYSVKERSVSAVTGLSCNLPASASQCGEAPGHCPPCVDEEDRSTIAAQDKRRGTKDCGEKSRKFSRNRKCDSEQDSETVQSCRLSKDSSDRGQRRRKCERKCDCDRSSGKEQSCGSKDSTAESGESSRKSDRKCDCEENSEKDQSCRSKDSSAECDHSCADRSEKDSCRKTRPCDRKKKRESGRSRKLKEDGRRGCDCSCDTKSGRSGSFEDDSQQAWSCDCDATTTTTTTTTTRNGRGKDCDPCQRRAAATRCDETVDNDDDDDAMRCVRRRDDESIESYVIRSILLLGSLANQSNSAAGPATGKSVAQAIEETLASIKCSDSSGQHTPPCQTCTEQCPDCSRNDNNRTGYSTARQHRTQLSEWLRAPMRGRNRFISTLGNRYSGHQSAYSHSRIGGGFSLDRSPMSKSSSFNTMQPTDCRTEESRSPRYRHPVVPRSTHHTHTYRSNRSDRERFTAGRSTWYNRTGASVGNCNMHANRTDSATSTTEEAGRSSRCETSRVSVGTAIEINSNNSRSPQDNDNTAAVSNKSAETPDSNDFSATGKTSSAVSDSAKRSSTDPSTGATKPANNNNSNNYSYVDNNNNNKNGDNYYTVMTVRPALCRLINELDNTNNNSINAAGEWNTQKRVGGSRRCRLPSRLNGRRSRRSAAAVKAISCSVLEVDAFLRQLDSERLHPDVQLLARVLDEYRTVLGLGGQRSLEAWPAAWRLARLPAGRWVVREVLKHAQASLSKFHSVKPSKFCRRRGLTALGLALLDGVNDSLTSRLMSSVSAELEQVILQRAVTSVVQALVDMTSCQRHRHHQQQQSVRRHC